MGRLAPTYSPREPHATVLYRLVKEHGAEFLRHARESYDGPLRRYVEDVLRGYLRCGDLSRGFVHLGCPRCQHDLVVAFSCKNRALCPSYAGRRTAAQAAHLVDCILPAVPIRQFVLSFPFELSLLAATKPEVLRELARIHAEELVRHYKHAAKESGVAAKLHAGAVTFVQRFRPPVLARSRWRDPPRQRHACPRRSLRRASLPVRVRRAGRQSLETSVPQMTYHGRMMMGAMRGLWPRLIQQDRTTWTSEGLAIRPSVVAAFIIGSIGLIGLDDGATIGLSADSDAGTIRDRGCAPNCNSAKVDGVQGSPLTDVVMFILHGTRGSKSGGLTPTPVIRF